MESVEVWMWTIAGIIVGSIIFLGAYKLLAEYTKHLELSQVDESFNNLRSSMDMACSQAVDSSMTRQYLFPQIVQKLFVTDNEIMEGRGQKLCILTSGENPRCHKLACMTTMKTLLVQSSESVFYFIQKALGQKKPVAAKFVVRKDNLRSLNVTWAMSYEKV